MSDKISRGDFLKRSGLAAAGMMMGGMASSAANILTPQQQQDKRSVSQNSER